MPTRLISEKILKVGGHWNKEHIVYGAKFNLIDAEWKSIVPKSEYWNRSGNTRYGHFGREVERERDNR